MGIFTASEKSGSKKIKEEGCIVTLQIEVPPAKFQEAVHTALVRLQAQAHIPGFRPGKAPLEIVRKQLAGTANERAVDQILHDAVPKALEEHRLHPVSSPAVHSMKLDPGKPVVFLVDVECPPRFQARDYKKLPVSRKRYPASDAELDRRLRELQDGNARLERSSREAVGKDHYVVLDYEGFVDGKPVKGAKAQDELLDMSSSDAAEGIIDGILGGKRGETREITSKLSGKPASFKVTVKEIKEKILPALDDEFAKDLGHASLPELRTKLRGLLEEEGRRKTEREVLGQIEQGLLQRNKFPAPPSLVETALDRMLERVRTRILGPRRDWPQAERDKLREQLRPKAEDEIRLSYLLRAIADAEKLAVADQDREAELNRGLQEAQSEEDKERLRQFFEERKDDIAGMLLERKTMEFLKNAAHIQDA